MADIDPADTKAVGLFQTHVDRSGGPQACWPWQRARTTARYGTLTSRGKTVYTHRAALILDGRPVPPGRAFAIHDCDNPPCCNPAHLSWADHGMNMTDARLKGRMARGGTQWNSKLTLEAVLAIRLSTEPKKMLAQRYGCSLPTITNIRTGVTWAHAPGPVRGRPAKPQLTPEVVLAIRNAAGTHTQIARQYGCSHSTVSHIKTGKTWRQIE